MVSPGSYESRCIVHALALDYGSRRYEDVVPQMNQPLQIQKGGSTASLLYLPSVLGS